MMKVYKLLVISILGFSLTSCGVLPIETEIKNGHFRFQDFSNHTGNLHEDIRLTCFRKRPVEWSIPRQYLAGEHNLWVNARVSKTDIPGAITEAYVNFAVSLDAGKSYTLNRKIDGRQISLWIEEIESGESASNVMVAKLKRPSILDDATTRKQCETSTI